MFKTEYLKFDDKVDLKVYIWTPNEGNLKGTVQIAHGMAEHLERYNEFAMFLNKHGYLVIGADHYGHGGSVKDVNKIGVVVDYDFMEAILQSIYKVRMNYQELFNEKAILFAHSMGSMAAQRYIELYPNHYNKVIISGTDYPFGKYFFANLLTLVNGKKGRIVYSKFIDNLGVGSFNKRFENEKTKVAWLTTDEDIQYKYLNDPLCGQMFPANYYHSLSRLLLDSKKMKNRKRINPHLEVMIMSGKDDPVGGFGKGPEKLAKDYLKLALHVHKVIYPAARHECLNEQVDIKNKVFNDIISFIKD